MVTRTDNDKIVIEENELSEALNEAESGSPASGHAVRDYFGTDEIFSRVVASADEEFGKSWRLLYFSGVAAGLSIGLSFLSRAAVTAEVMPDGSALIGNLIYPIGFMLIVLGRYQLFTENTLTPVTLVLTRIASVPMLLSNWGVVLAGNLTGAMLMGLVMATSGVLGAESAEVAASFGEHGLALSWGTLFTKAIVAGWIVASMVWLVHAAQDTISRIVIVFLLMFLIPSADLFHCIIGACEVFYMVFEGLATLPDGLFNFFLPVLLGNTLGGVTLVAILNFAQTSENLIPEGHENARRLTLNEWLTGFYRYGVETPEDAEKKAA